jgi:PAS domain S-box-containing protein
MADPQGPSNSTEGILQSLPCGYLAVDSQEVIRAWNVAAATFLGVDAARLAGKPLFEAVPFWRNTPFAKALEGLCASQTLTGTMVFELPTPDERWLSVHVSALPPEAGQGVLVSLMDATELVRLKGRLRWTEYQASIGKLARGIAHELNNPLDGVLRYTHLALEQLTEDSAVREYLVHVKEGLDRMLRAARAFLEFSRQATTPVDRLADLNRLIDDALILFKHRAKFQQVRLVTQLDSSLPKVSDGGLQHAVVNLVKNAFDAMPRGGTLTITTRYDEGFVEIEVEDTGSGITEDVRTRLFQPFFSTKPIHQGSGLGLVIAKEAAERSGGRISFTSQAGVGTVFRLRIPVAVQDCSDDGAQSHPSR